MADTVHTLTLSNRDLINLALATSSDATSAYIDERLLVAATNHELAARLWAEAGYDTTAAHHTQLSLAITREAIEACRQAEDEEGA